MKKIMSLLLIFSIFITCVSKQEKVEKITENGIEIIINHLKPYNIKGELRFLSYEKEFSIDTENEEIFNLGLSGIENFDVDSEGNIYLIQWEIRENFIFKFDKEGKYLTSFCQGGQGPGEIEWGGTVLVNPQEEILVKDPSKSKFALFNNTGNFIKEIRMERNYSPIPLENGNILVFWPEDTQEFRKQLVGICDAEFQNAKVLDTFWYPNAMYSKSPVNRDRLIYKAIRDKIFIGNTERGYEICEYDLDGNLVKKIRKEFEPVEVTEEYKKVYFGNFPEGHPMLEMLYFTKNWPPFRDFFPDESGRLFVMTYEKGSHPDEYNYDIFNSEGIFIGRMSLPNTTRLDGGAFPIKIKNDLLYCLEEKESGYKKFVVYKMEWE